MKFSASEIRIQKFKSRLSGVDPAEVSNYLEKIAGEWERMQQQQTEMREKVVELETKLKDYVTIEKALQQTFMQAQETTAKAVENARKEAHLIIQDAELKATKIVDHARTELSALKEQVTVLRAKKDSITARLKMMLNSELELIRALEIDEELISKSTDRMQEESSKEKTEIEEIIKRLG